MNHAEKAVEYYSNNFNCSQGVFTTYAMEMGMDEKMALMLETNFGGGERKAYGISEEFMNGFIEKNGSVVCRELLGYDLTKEEDMKIIKKENLFRTFCPKMVRSAAEILDEMINEGERLL